MSPRPIAGAFSPRYPYDNCPAGVIGTLEVDMKLELDPHTGRRVFIPVDEGIFWLWHLKCRPNPLTNPSPD